MNRLKSFLKSGQFVSLVWIIGIVLAWEIAAFFIADVFHDKMMNSKLPFLHNILGTIIENFALLVKACAITLSRAIIGFAAGALIGFCARNIHESFPFH